jgi:hypothetical protein
MMDECGADSDNDNDKPHIHHGPLLSSPLLSETLTHVSRYSVSGRWLTCSPKQALHIHAHMHMYLHMQKQKQPWQPKGMARQRFGGE